jgi:hypothetical protein
VPSREGAGVLDVATSAEAASSLPRGAEERPAGEQSRLRAARDAAWADPTRELSMLLWLRDAGGAVFDAGAERVSVRLADAELRGGVERVAPGLYRFSVAAGPRAPAFLQVDVAFDAEPLLSLELPIEGGGSSSRRDDGGCALPGGRPAPVGAGRATMSLAALALVCARRGLRARSSRR